MMRTKVEKLFDKMIVPDPKSAWRIFGEYIVHKHFSREFEPVPYLDPNDCPCIPGTVALVKEQSWREYLTMRKRKAVFAGNLWDFCHRGKQKWQVPVSSKCYNEHAEIERTFTVESKDRTKSVTFEFQGLEAFEFDYSNHTDGSQIKVDLDNYSDTGFHEDLMYLVTHTCNMSNIKVTATVGGRTTSHVISSSTPIAYKCVKMMIDKNGRIDVSTLQKKKRSAPKILKRSNYQTLINHMMPNQCRFGMSVGETSQSFNPPPHVSMAMAALLERDAIPVAGGYRLRPLRTRFQ